MVQFQNSDDPTGVTGDESSKRANATLRDARNRKADAAVALKLAGASWAEIAKTVGYPTPRQALVATERALVRRLDSTDREHLRKLAGARLDRLLMSVWAKATDQNHPEHLYAVGKAREIIADHRKVWGLDAPTEVVVHNPTQAELDAWVAAVLQAGAPPVAEYDIISGEVVETSAIEGTG